MSTCPRCAHESGSSDFCDVCGTSLRGTVTTEPEWHDVGSGRTARREPGRAGTPGFCPDCGTRHEADEQFCENCGYDLETRESLNLRAMASASTTIQWELTVGTDPQRWLRTDLARKGEVPKPTRAVVLNADRYTLGRAAGAGRVHADLDISTVTGDSAISRRHAVLERDPARDQWTIADLGSSNGTLINGHAVTTQPVLLGQGDVVVLGAWTALVLRRR